MSSIGMNVDREGWSDLEQVASLGATWIRIVATPEADLTVYLTQARDLNLNILLVLARESGFDYEGYVNRYGHLIDAVQVGNEPDIDSPSSWTMTPKELTARGYYARAVFPEHFPIVTGGFASGHPEWLTGMDISWADAIAFHPYLKDAPNSRDIEDLPDVTELMQGYQQFQKPLLITEWGWWGEDEQRGAEEVRDMTLWAARTPDIEVYFHFCLSDQMVPPFGLYRHDGSAKPAQTQFISAASTAIPSPWPSAAAPVPVPIPDPVPTKPLPGFDPWQWWTPEQISEAIGANLDHVKLYWPKLAEQLHNTNTYTYWNAIAELATIAVEVGSRFEPIHEYGTPADWQNYSGGSRYAGRGFIQLTHDYNYEHYGKAVDDLWQAGGAIDLVARPEDALDPDVAAAVMALFFQDHGIPAMAEAQNWAGVRQAVNGGFNGWQTFADAVEALKAIPLAPEAPDPTPVPEPPHDIRDQTIADLTLALRTLRDDTLPKLRTQLDEAQRIVTQFVGENT